MTVTFWRIGKDQPIKEGALGGENVENSGENQLSERQVLICNMLKVNGENSARSLARILNLSQRTVEREISFLRNHGFIDKDGTKNGVWKVLKCKCKSNASYALTVNTRKYFSIEKTILYSTYMLLRQF